MAQVLSLKELQFGCILLDLGFEKTSLGLFRNLALVHSITLPFGVNHITKDISKVCSLNLDESKIIRDNIDFSFQNNQNLFNKNGFLKDTYFIDSKVRKISKSLILNIVKARLDEIFGIIKKQILISGFSLTSEINLFLAEGGSNIFSLEKYSADFFGVNVKKIGDGDFEKDFSSCLGALKIIKDGWETEAIPVIGKNSIEKIGFFARVFRTLR